MSTPALQFVVLHHTGWDGHTDHYDFLLEKPAEPGDEYVLMSFKTLTNEFPDGKSHSDRKARQEKSGDPTTEINLMTLNNDHRRAYLTHTGAVSGNRGVVTQIEKGELAWLLPPEGNLQELKVNLKGKLLVGDFRIRHMGQGIYHFERMKR
jgi:hypothetical protein